jgi:hypothetical protein
MAWFFEFFTLKLDEQEEIVKSRAKRFNSAGRVHKQQDCLINAVPVVLLVCSHLLKREWAIL